LLDSFFAADPEPDLATEASTTMGAMLAGHLLQLTSSCGLLNVAGKHSSAVVLLRSLEDALDCFAAVTLVPGAAEDWGRGALRPSDAAKRWTPLHEPVVAPGGLTLAEYRKAAREAFHRYSHCSYDLCCWDLYLRPAPHPTTGEMGAVIEINRTGLVIDSNCHAIDAHVTAHLLEFVGVVETAYGKALDSRPETDALLRRCKHGITEIMEQHNKHGCQDVRFPPEIRPREPGESSV
jgi:hypothetical protein